MTHVSVPRARGSASGKRGTPEADAQRQIVSFLRLVLPREAIVHHSANEVSGGGRSARNRQAVLVGMGVHAGFSDLMVISGGRVLFLEVKSAAGRLQPSQAEFRDAVRAQGFGWALVRSIEDTAAALQAHDFSMRLRLIS